MPFVFPPELQWRSPSVSGCAVYRSSKNSPKRSPKVMRIERIVAVSLWSFIAVGITLLLLFKR